MALESPQPNERRRGVVGLSESRDATSDWALKVYDTVARSDVDASVRSAALRAMERIADPQSQATATAVLQSKRKSSDGIIPAPASVRWGAARVLHAIAAKSGTQADSNATLVAALVDAVRSETDQRVRLTVIDTLGFYRDRSVPPVLVDALEEEDFAVRRAAETSLVALTGVTHNYDAKAWRAWLAKTSDPFASAGQSPDGWNDNDEKPKWDWLQLPG
ncbi:MAG: HEAT repeat domain-containing protein [Phycisphaerales bacterium]|nr:HEAT repeat domain-containing protein [Phycisphaerales bacterium]MCB9862405.1 HEAT repeat domain-containing protein [Phycisphaerales bacterium]